MSSKLKRIITSIVLIIIMALCGIISINKLGVKDGAMVTLSLLLTGVILYMALKDIKKSIFLFIIAMPILVTARKLFYVDIFIITLNLETIIILFLFITKFKMISNKFMSLLNSRSYRIIAYSIIIYVISAYISVMFSSDIGRSLSLTTTSIIIPIILLVTIIGVLDKKDTKHLIYSLAISVNFSCLYGFVQAAGVGLSLSALKDAREMLTFGYHNVNIFVTICLMVFPLLLNELLYKKVSMIERIFLIVSILIQGLSVFITFSRGAWLSLGMIAIAILFSKKYKYLFVTILSIGILASPFVLPTIMSRGESDEHFLQNTSNSARVQSIVTSFDIMKKYPFGSGFGEFNNVFRENVVDGYLSINEDLRDKMRAPLYSLESAHNYLLNTGVELGIVAMVFMIILLINILIKCIKNYKDNRGVFISLMIFIFLGLTTGIEINHKGVITNTYIFWIIISMVYLYNDKKEIDTDGVL